MLCLKNILKLEDAIQEKTKNNDIINSLHRIYKNNLMKIYLAGGMTVMNVIGRERELYNRFPTWKRLFSYHYLKLIYKSEILDISRENLPSSTRTPE